jgi:hypothetical protein
VDKFSNSGVIIQMCKWPSAAGDGRTVQYYVTYKASHHIRTYHWNVERTISNIEIDSNENYRCKKKRKENFACCYQLLHHSTQGKIPLDWLDDDDGDDSDEDDDSSNIGDAIGEYHFGLPVEEDDERCRHCIEYFRDMGML